MTRLCISIIFGLLMAVVVADNFADSFNSDDASNFVAPESTWASEVELFQEPEPTPAKINKTPAKIHKKIQSMLSTLSLAQASPEEPEIDLVDVSYTEAKKQVSALLQAGKDENACKELTKTLSDDVLANVATQQKTLDGMPKGESECDDEGAFQVSKAEERLTAANTDHENKMKELEVLESTKLDFGKFEFKELTEGQCGDFFNKKVWTDAKAAVAKATIDEKAAKKAISVQTLALEDDKKEAKKLVKACRCKAKKLLDETLKTMNANAKTEHVKAWTQAAHMNCVLEGTPVSKCTVRDLPVVKETTVSEKVKNSCSPFQFSAKLGLRNRVPPRSYEFGLAQVSTANNFQGNDFRVQSRTECLKLGMLAVCDHPSYCKADAAAMYIGQDNHISHGSHLQNPNFFPSGWNDIKENFYGTCVYSFNANGPHSLCNNDANGAGNGFAGKGGNPWGSHAWLRPSQTQGTGVDGKPNMGRFFMCAKIHHRAYTVKLGAKNGVPAQTVEFKMATSLNLGAGRIDNVHKSACSNIGMKPVCDHPSYCKNDKDSIYIGQDHHFAHGPHRRTLSYFPSGWQQFVNDYYPETLGMCAYTGAHNGLGSTLCNTGGDSHEWKTAAQVHEFMCARVI